MELIDRYLEADGSIWTNDFTEPDMGAPSSSTQPPTGHTSSFYKNET
jgi:hypothetical protein